METRIPQWRSLRHDRRDFISQCHRYKPRITFETPSPRPRLQSVYGRGQSPSHRAGPFFYPDLVVTCDERDQKANRVIRYPCLIVEVLSPSTEGFDRGEKFKQYRRLETLKEYLLVSAETTGIECFRLNAQNKWELTADFAENSGDAEKITIELTSIDFQCSLAEIYDEVNLTGTTAELFEEI
jgi:Uma2 family endonuclease